MANPLSSSANFLLAQFLGRLTFSLPFLVNGMHRYFTDRYEAAAPWSVLPAVRQIISPYMPQLTCRQWQTVPAQPKTMRCAPCL